MSDVPVINVDDSELNSDWIRSKTVAKNLPGEMRKAAMGETIAYRGDGSSLVYDYTDEFGEQWGHIVSRDGDVYLPRRLVVLLSHGYWRATPDG